MFQNEAMIPLDLDQGVGGQDIMWEWGPDGFRNDAESEESIVGKDLDRNKIKVTSNRSPFSPLSEGFPWS